MTSILEIIQIKVNPRFTSEPDLFVQLRVGAQKGGVKEQLFGLSVERTDELTWILRKFTVCSTFYARNRRCMFSIRES